MFSICPPGLSLIFSFFSGWCLTGWIPFLSINLLNQQHQSTEGKHKLSCLNLLLYAVVCTEWGRLNSGSQNDRGDIECVVDFFS